MRKPYLAALIALAMILAACAADDASDTTVNASDTTAATDGSGNDTTTTAGDGGSVCEGATLTFIGLAGEEGDVELADWRAENNVALEGSWPGAWPELISAVTVGQTYDLATIPYHQGQRMILAGILQPIDTSRLSHWDDLYPGLAEHPSLRGEDGQVYGVPIAWGDGPYIYSPERVDTVPASILDLADPEWQGRFVLFDAPEQVFYLVALANGFTDAPLLTPEQLETVAEQSEAIVNNASAFNNGYQDATDRLVAGDIDLAIGGWEAMLTWAAEDGVELDFGFFEESPGGWWDGLAIPTTADDVDCAYEYIDMMISPETNAEVGTNLISAVVNKNSVALVGEVAQIYDYAIVEGTGGRTFESTTPPEDPGDGYTSYEDWLDAWQQIKAG